MNRVAAAALVAVTAIWGATFVTVKEAIQEIPPYEFLSIRFILAAALLALLFPRRTAGIKGGAFRASLLIGAALAVGYAFQTIGLQYTTATNAGFVTGLFVVFTPLIAAIVLRRLPGAVALAGVAMAAGGLALLTLGPAWGRGDLLVLVTAVAFAVHIVLLGRFSPHYDARTLAVGQLSVCAVGFTAISIAAEPFVPPVTASVWFAIALTAVGASAAGFLIQTWAQSLLSPTRTAVTLTMEPVFAGMFGFLLLGERLSARGWVGAALIFAAILMVSLRPASPTEES